MQKMITIPVDEFTTPVPTTVEPATPINKVMDLMHDQGIRHLPVAKAEKTVGMISDRDLRMFTALGGGDHITAEDIMTPHPYGVRSGTPLDQVAFNMSKEKIGSAIVVDDDDDIVGIFTSTDALNALIEVLRGELED